VAVPVAKVKVGPVTPLMVVVAPPEPPVGQVVIHVSPIRQNSVEEACVKSALGKMLVSVVEVEITLRTTTGAFHIDWKGRKTEPVQSHCVLTAPATVGIKVKATMSPTTNDNKFFINQFQL
jgi:hypothetical protein